MDQLRISLVQSDIIWENKKKNLSNLRNKLEILSGKTDIAVLPEMFSTGFSMNSNLLAEPITGETITMIKNWSIDYQIAITGSFICEEKESFYNRAFFITPDNKEFYYDKKHLFRMGDEPNHFKAGNKRCIFNYNGWNISLAVCYDLRFPVWLRNRRNEYDLLIIVANWPSARKNVWENLIVSRAIENQSYVCGVNRVGTDGNGLLHPGKSILLNAKGESLTTIPDDIEYMQTVTIDLSSLNAFRKKFPVWEDADEFCIK